MCGRMARWPNAIAELQGRTPRSVKRYKFYVYYTLIMRVYKQITFMAQSTLGNRHRCPFSICDSRPSQRQRRRVLWLSSRLEHWALGIGHWVLGIEHWILTSRPAEAAAAFTHRCLGIDIEMQLSICQSRRRERAPPTKRRSGEARMEKCFHR